jgi:hypothetical protein
MLWQRLLGRFFLTRGNLLSLGHNIPFEFWVSCFHDFVKMLICNVILFVGNRLLLFEDCNIFLFIKKGMGTILPYQNLIDLLVMYSS